MNNDIMSSTPTSSLSVELRVLILCFVKLTIGNHLPIVRTPLVCPHILSCTAKLASAYQFRTPVPLTPNVKGKSIVERKYLIRCSSFVQLSISGDCTLVVRNAVASNPSGLALLTGYNALASM